MQIFKQKWGAILALILAGVFAGMYLAFCTLPVDVARINVRVVSLWLQLDIIYILMFIALLIMGILGICAKPKT